MSRHSKLSIDKIYDVRDKIKNVQYYIDLTLNRTLSMFKYNNLPESIPEVELEKILQLHGYGIITKIDGELVALWGGYAPPLDIYYRHTRIIVNNPWGNINKTFQFYPNKDSKELDCVLIKNDPLGKGLLPIFKRYGTMLTEADITLYLSMLNLRTIYSIMANNDEEKESAELFLKLIEDGRQGVMMQDEFGDGIKTNPYSNSSQGYITQLIELEQYLKGSFFNDIGLNSNYNMKRERLNSSEVELNEDGLRPLIDSMLEERQKAVDEINKKYGTNITVEFGSSWEQYNEDYEDEVVEDEQPLENVDDTISSEEVVEETSQEVEEQETTQPEETSEEVNDEDVSRETSEEQPQEIEEQQLDNEDVDDTISEEVEPQEEVQEEVQEQPSIEVNIEINSDTIEDVKVEETQEEPVEDEVVDEEVVEDNEDNEEETTDEDEEDEEDE